MNRGGVGNGKFNFLLGDGCLRVLAFLLLSLVAVFEIKSGGGFSKLDDSVMVCVCDGDGLAATLSVKL